MRKGSPRDYHPERGFQGPAQNTHTGEPHECRSLYRIRRPQEKYQLLRQNGCRRNCEGRQAGGRSSYSHGMGRETDAAVAWRHGGNAFQRVDLRHPEALRRATGDGASRENESHYLWKEEERQNRRAHHCRLAALQPAARVLRDAARAARFTASVTLSQPGSPGICTDANKIAGLLMETGSPFNKEKLHGKKYFAQLIQTLEQVPESVKDLLQMSRSAMEMFETTQKRLVKQLLVNPALAQRIERLAGIRGVGEITALTWALEIGDPHRFRSNGDAMSYCGLTAAWRSSADKQQRGPISKQRNAWLQTTLIEAAKLAPRWNPQLAAVHAHELERGHRNRATLMVARKLVAYLLAVDKSQKPFEVRDTASTAACAA